MLIFALILAVGALAVGIRSSLEVLRSLPRSNQDWVWY